MEQFETKVVLQCLLFFIEISILTHYYRKRKANTEVKYQRLATGGGPEPVEEPDPVMEAVSIAAPHADFTLPCPWDSTGVYEAKQCVENATNSTG